MTKKLKAAVISLGSESSEWTADSMRKYFDEVIEIDLKKIDISISGKDAEILYDGKPLGEFDCIYIKGSFRYAQLLQTLTSLLNDRCYMPISADAFTIVHDKLLTQLELQKHNIPMPRTYISATIPAAKKILENMNFPIMMKFPHGTGGKGVLFADSYASASSLLDALSALRQPFLIQEYVDTGGTDIRAIVVGNRVVASMRRHAGPQEARANFHSGGTGEPIKLDAKTEKLAVTVAKALRADICAVDILESAKGPLVIEANLSPGLQLISKTTKIDISDIIARFLNEKTTEMKNAKADHHTSKMMSHIDDKKDEEGKKILMAQLDFRGNRILLPEVATRISEFSETDSYEITAQADRISIKKINITDEKKQ